MRTYLGVAMGVVGLMLVMFGLDASDSLASRFSRLFTGSPTDRTIWLLIAGVVVMAAGAAMVFTRRGHVPK